MQKKEKKQQPTEDALQHRAMKHKPEMWLPAPSLKPGKTAIEAAAEEHPYALAIRDAWQFKAPVTTMTPEAYKRLIERSSITFGG